MTASEYITIIPTKFQEKAIPYLEHLDEIMESNSISTPLRKTHFLAQVTEESQWFKCNSENLNYSAKALKSVFGKYFPTTELADEYARQPEKIANLVYANRMENGDESSGDGWRYRGRGLIELTGKINYRKYGEARGTDFISAPEKLIEPYYAIDSAVWYWNSHKLNDYADKDDILTITKRINGGTNGLEIRKEHLLKFKSLFSI